MVFSIYNFKERELERLSVVIGYFGFIMSLRVLVIMGNKVLLNGDFCIIYNKV